MSRKSIREQAAAFDKVGQANTAMKAALAEAQARQNARAKVQRKLAGRKPDPVTPLLAALIIIGVVFGLHFADAKAPQAPSHPIATPIIKR